MLGRLLVLIKSDLRCWKGDDDIAFIPSQCWGLIQTEPGNQPLGCAAPWKTREELTAGHTIPQENSWKKLLWIFYTVFHCFFSYCPYRLQSSLDIHTTDMFLQNSHLLPDNVLIDIWGKQWGRGQKSRVHGGHDSSSDSSNANDRDVGGCEVLQSNG